MARKPATAAGTAPTEPELTYEQARAELIDVVTNLESGQVPLAASMQLWERGETLAKICQTWLDGAKAKVSAAASE
ncbi:MAG: exodeoxyribonuclease VII small subunit [Propionibacteriaceae bacterium]|jgi:exodeoxyribonuclease VII small subunit|nr:exodeoxyribonuclease VII small subunit [Propionibacteriaceae bacterium]